MCYPPHDGSIILFLICSHMSVLLMSTWVMVMLGTLPIPVPFLFLLVLILLFEIPFFFLTFLKIFSMLLVSPKTIQYSWSLLPIFIKSITYLPTCCCFKASAKISFIHWLYLPPSLLSLKPIPPSLPSPSTNVLVFHRHQPCRIFVLV